MERTTHEITTPITKATVVLYDWVTGFDEEAIQVHYLNGAKNISGDQNGKASADYNGNAIIDADHEALRRVVVSVNGNADDVVNLVMSMPSYDSKFVAEEVKKVLHPLVEMVSQLQTAPTS